MALMLAFAIVWTSLGSFVCATGFSRCSSGASCHIGEDVMFLQSSDIARRHSAGVQGEGLPDFEELQKHAKSFGSGKSGVEVAMEAVLDMLTKRINKSMDKVDDCIERYAQSAAAAVDGAAEMAARISKKGQNASQDAEARIAAVASAVRTSTNDTLEVWDTVASQLQGLTSFLPRGLRAIGAGSLAESLAVTLTTVSERLEAASNATAAARRLSKHLPTALRPETYAAAAVAPAVPAVLEALRELDAALEEAQGLVVSFTDAYSSSLDDLALGVIQAVQDNLPEVSIAEIDAGLRAVLHRLEETARKFAHGTKTVQLALHHAIENAIVCVEDLGGDSDGGSNVLQALRDRISRIFR
eukprot:TRINITY_DN22966_c0_g1_i1.p1 TRINITY_DN22966_c0_g1~~TRINITY_DN22966_c0_g1_i1.p1  ORF type:complete len:357 (+),score=82.71 TRINITY_DN22966_c0_g1_i1:62-1132(+)